MPNLKSTILAGAVAVGVASAQETWTMQRISYRIPAELVGDTCHPDGTYSLGVAGRPIPPCIAKQIISTKCEQISGFLDDKENKVKALVYQNCLFGEGSSYEKDMAGCLRCKLDSGVYSKDEHDFWSAAQREAVAEFKQNMTGGSKEEVTKHPDSFWGSVLGQIHWERYPSSGTRGGTTTGSASTPVDYIQNIGSAKSPSNLSRRGGHAGEPHKMKLQKIRERSGELKVSILSTHGSVIGIHVA
ncbi:hypothetical protein DCS_00107 [Drechmeria coniospora]|uniref:Uncharacterized protein n=1 Tax=Drechmeria coniospora TaxID=98403 RepID=A0A151GPG9_DRECN|nr:hypothetical protein DCS_00107 [Drechmeria coniospora]KYK58980.1 hypothetical protein DCS_00107 [Drechmeria coniospora]